MTIFTFCGFPLTTFPGVLVDLREETGDISGNTWCQLHIPVLSHDVAWSRDYEGNKPQITPTPRSPPNGWPNGLFVLLALFVHFLWESLADLLKQAFIPSPRCLSTPPKEWPDPESHHL